MTDVPDLTKNQQAVLGCLEKATGAMTAYDILDGVRAQGIRAPVQVYRALERLMELSIVHRIESMNAFVACAHGHEGADHDHGHSGTVAFAICDDCGHVSEIPVPKAAKTLGALAGDSGFVTERAVVELRGHCQACTHS
ncbi:MAG: transcriptional repressor [Rhodospirillales bacterium]|nr:transcriptional repressor [Rhodospirillales bacterium]MBO6788695.1 transcriptional repressor [Rhodospirillales bacterium]